MASGAPKIHTGYMDGSTATMKTNLLLNIAIKEFIQDISVVKCVGPDDLKAWYMHFISHCAFYGIFAPHWDHIQPNNIMGSKWHQNTVRNAKLMD